MSQRQWDDSKPASWMLREAKYGGQCAQCKEEIAPGDQVYMKPVVDEETQRKTWQVVHSFHGEPTT